MLVRLSWAHVIFYQDRSMFTVALSQPWKLPCPNLILNHLAIIWIKVMEKIAVYPTLKSTLVSKVCETGSRSGTASLPYGSCCSPVTRLGVRSALRYAAQSLIGSQAL